MKNRLSELEFKMQEDGFWNDPEKAQSVTKEVKGIKDRLELMDDLEKSLVDTKELCELYGEEENTSEYKTILKDYTDIKSKVDSLKTEALLFGEYDKNNALLSLHVGVGGKDAEDWTEMLLRMYTRWLDNKGFTYKTIECVPAEFYGIKSVTLEVSGLYAYGYLKSEKGIHRLVRISPFNSNGKRQTSFASVEVLPELEDYQDIEIKQDDLKIDTFRSGGAGGQNVNKTESAIRITHLPTGIVVQCQNERSQLLNKESAISMLKSKLIELKDRMHKEKIEDLTGDMKEISWGSQIRSYVFHPYNLVKDHRTGIETSNVQEVMDGNIDIFINEYLSGANK